MSLAVWLLSLPFRLLAALGLRRSVILACLLVLGRHRLRRGRGPGPDRAPGPGRAGAQAGRRPAPPEPGRHRRYPGRLPAPVPPGRRDLRVPWSVLAAIGKVESDHGRLRLPGVRSGLNRYRDRSGRWRRCCAGPMQFNLTDGPPSTWQRHGHGNVYDPADAIPAAARKLIADGARGDLDRALYAYNHSRAYVARVKRLARAYAGSRR